MELKDPQTQKLLLGVILVLGLGYAFHQYLYRPKQEQIAELEAQAERLESYNQQAKRTARSNRVAELEEESVAYARRLETVEQLIPTTEQVPQLLERVATAALESEVDLLSFTPLPAEPGTYYTEQFYEVEVRGGYHEIGTFLARIANLPRIIRPSVTELLGERVEAPTRGRPPDPNEPPPPPVTLVHAKLRLSAYVLPGGEAAVAGADTTGAKRPPGGLGAGAEATGVGAVPQAAAPAPAPAPASAAPVAPPLAERIAPGVAPALEAERRRAQAAAAVRDTGGAGTAGEAAGGPGAGGAPAAGQAAPGAAAPAGAPPPAAAGEPAGPAAAPGRVDAALTQPAPSPRTPADLTPPGGRATREDEPRRPGALPPLGPED